jgi:hypothetical protein
MKEKKKIPLKFEKQGNNKFHFFLYFKEFENFFFTLKRIK